MAEFQPVPIGRPAPRSWLPAIGAALAIVLLLAIVEPWAPPDPAAPGAGVAAVPTGVVAPATARPRPDRDSYDPRLFGLHEPGPAWELWPAGYVVEFGIAGPRVVRGQETAGPSQRSDETAEPEGTGTIGAPAPTPTPPPLAPEGDVVDLGPADHLIALGINTPADVRIADVRLLQQGRRRCFCVDVRLVRLPTPWASKHFVVIGIADPERPGEPGPWIPGEYLLELVTVEGDVRAVRVRVSAPVD
jgi:hypothetical protein